MSKKLNIMNIFFEHPTREFNVREIARMLKISPATASKELKALKKESLLKERKDRIFTFYKANLESDLYLDNKRFYNIRKIKESGFIEELNKFYLKPTIILFGSTSHGLDDETSDIDLAVISENTKSIKDLKKFEKKLNKKIQLFALKDVRDIKNEHLVNNIINGIVLQGQVKWI